MTKRFWMGLAIVLVVPGLMFAASCAKKVACGPAWTPDEREEPLVAAAPATAAVAESREEMVVKDEFPDEDIYFDYDKSGLLSDAQDNLRAKAEWLMAHPDVSAIIEGHCDERGTNEYNIALGDRRAASAKSFLVDIGVADSRLTTISYGEEKPVVPESNEEAWAKNRRVHFVIE